MIKALSLNSTPNVIINEKVYDHLVRSRISINCSNKRLPPCHMIFELYNIKGIVIILYNYYSWVLQ